MPTITKDTEAILLLCCRLPRDLASDNRLKPLTHSEYISLARWLFDNDLRPSDLLTESWRGLEFDQSKVGIDYERLSKLLARGVAISFARERWERAGIWMISRADDLYPKRWKKLLKNRAPALLYGVGNFELLEQGGLGVVGSRNIDENIENYVSELASRSAMTGVNIVSGGARGVDSIAMEQSTQAGGKTLGILADSLLKGISKKSNRHRIESGQLTLVTPFSPEAGFNSGNAMSRNKLIYASADCVVVAQSDKGKGGTWNGAIECLNHQWVPVLVQNDFPSEGLKALIKQGGKPISMPEADQFTMYFNKFLEEARNTLKQGSIL